MGITCTGDNLKFIISCDYCPHHDWMTFATWYSIYKNIPDAECMVLCSRAFPCDRILFNWPFRCNIRFFQHENLGDKKLNKFYAAYSAIQLGYVTQPFFVIDPLKLCVRNFSKKTISILNDGVRFLDQNDIIYFNDQPIDVFKNMDIGDAESAFGKSAYIDELCVPAKSESPATFIDLSKGFEIYNKNLFEHSKSIDLEHLEYTNEKAMVEWGCNEKKALALWKKMSLVYKIIR